MYGQVHDDDDFDDPRNRRKKVAAAAAAQAEEEKRRMDEYDAVMWFCWVMVMMIISCWGW